MKIAYYSDLHLEFKRLDIINEEADVVILAGDIHIGEAGVVWAAETFEQPVVMIAGNHEFYNHHNVNMTQIIDSMKAASKNTNVHVLNNENIIINDINFIGSTLWTDFELNNSKERAMTSALQMINDYSLINVATSNIDNRLFTPVDAANLFKLAVEFIQSSIKPDLKNIIITHHGVAECCSHQDYREDILSAAFNSDLEQFITSNKEDITAWIYGHTHFNLDFEISSVPVLTNQRGYAPYELVTGFDPNKILVV